MRSDSSLPAGFSSIDPRVVSLGFVAAVVFVTFVGPESYFGVSDTVVGWLLLAVFIVWTLSRRSGGTYDDVETDPATPAAMGEHYRPTGAGVTDGVYRVVGTRDPIALLRVGDANGKRVTTGEVAHVSQPTLDAEFEAARDPDAALSPVAGLRNALSGLFWSVRRLF